MLKNMTGWAHPEKRVHLFILAASAILFFILAYFVTSGSENIIDEDAFVFCRRFTCPAVTQLGKIITFFGTGTFLIPCYVLIIYLLVKKGRKRLAVISATIAVSGLLLGWLLKDLFHRTRPPYHLVNGAGGYSFPSGHALGGFIFTGVVLSVLWKTSLNSSFKYLFSVFIILFGSLIGISRIYLHVHFATDVLGSLLIAILWFSLLHFAFRSINIKEISKTKKLYPDPSEYSPDNYSLN